MLSLIQLKKKKKMNYGSILKWLSLSGITECIGEKPINRFLNTDLQENKSKQFVAPESIQTPPKNKQDIETTFISQATNLANNASDLTNLDSALNSFDGCSLRKTAQHTLSGMGISNQPTVLCLIDSPKSADEKIGRLAAGDSGELLLKMLKAIQLDCGTNTYLCPLIPWRLPGDRVPTETEVNLCLPFLKKRIELIQPQFILIFGSLPTRGLLGIESISKARQQNLSYSLSTGNNIPVIATFGPDMVMKGQSYRKNAWDDLQKLAKLISNN